VSSRVAGIAAVGAVTVALAAALASGSARGDVAFEPGDFDRSWVVDNRWLPLTPGTEFVFTGRSNDGVKRLVFTVTDLVKVVGGVRNVVVWDRDFTDGELVEAELAFFAQDNAGNVWHTGEYPEEYEAGKIVGIPAWLHGVKGATAGIEMNAEPRLGLPGYPQGFAPPPVNWNDHARIFRTGERVCVPVRCYADVLITREYTPGEPGAQLKYYATGVGNIRVGWAGKDPDREAVVLARLVRLSPAQLAKAREAALALDKRAYTTRPKVYGQTPPARRLP
jgi:hypothetical protein